MSACLRACACAQAHACVRVRVHARARRALWPPAGRCLVEHAGVSLRCYGMVAMVAMVWLLWLLWYTNCV